MSDNSGLTIVFVAVYIVVAAGFYVWSSLATAKVFTALGERGWKGWVPVLSTITILELGSFSGVWVITLFFPVVQIAGLVVFFAAINTINKRFGRGAGFTVLAVFAYPIWATILGFGRGVTDRVSALPAPVATAFDARMNALQSPPAVVPLPPVVTPTLPAPVPGPTPVPGPAPVPEPVEGPPAPQAPPAQPDPWSPPINTAALPPRPVAPPAPPVQPPPPRAVPEPTPPVPEALGGPPLAAPTPLDDATLLTTPAADLDDDVEKTVLSKRNVPKFTLTPSGGSGIALTKDRVVLGRNPAASADDIDAQLVAVPDISKTMSKTHARLQLAGGTWTITDLNSTNGVILVDAAGVETELEAGATAQLTETFKLGELTLTIRTGN